MDSSYIPGIIACARYETSRLSWGVRPRQPTTMTEQSASRDQVGLRGAAWPWSSVAVAATAGVAFATWARLRQPSGAPAGARFTWDVASLGLCVWLGLASWRRLGRVRSG